MDLQPYIDRVKTAVPLLRDVGGAAELSAALTTTTVPPAVFIVPLLERSTAPEADACESGSREVTVGVLIVVQNQRDAGGAAALGELNVIRPQVLRALVGWMPKPATYEKVRWLRGELVDFPGDGTLWWGDDLAYRTDEPF